MIEHAIEYALRVRCNCFKFYEFLKYRKTTKQRSMLSFRSSTAKELADEVLIN